MDISKEIASTTGIEALKSILDRLDTTFNAFRKEFQPRKFNSVVSSLLRKFYVEKFLELLTHDYQERLRSFIVKNTYPSTCIQQILNVCRILEQKKEKPEDDIFIQRVGIGGKMGHGYRKLRKMIQEIVYTDEFASLAFDEYLKLSKGTKFSLSIEQITRIYISVPDKIVGISNQSFYAKLTKNMLSFFSLIEDRHSKPNFTTSKRNQNLAFVVSILSLLCKRGYSDLVSFHTLKSISRMTESNDCLSSIINEWKKSSKSNSSTSFKKFAYGLIKIVSKQNEPWKFYRILFDSFVGIMKKESNFRRRSRKILTNFLTSEFLLPPRNYHRLAYQSDQVTLSSPSQVIQAFLALLFLRAGQVLLPLEHLLTLWKQDRFVKFSPEETQEGVTMMILRLLHISKKAIPDLLQKKMGMLQKLMIDGVNVRLDVNIIYIRRHAIFMAETFSELVSQKTEFTEFKGEKKKLESFFDKSNKLFEQRVFKEQKKEVKKEVDPKKKLDSSETTKSKKSEETQKKEKKVMKEKKRKVVDPDASIFEDDDDDDDSSSSSSEEEEDKESGEEEDDSDDQEKEDESEESDVDSLQSFGLDDDDTKNEELKQQLRTKTVMRPTFIRDLIPLITAESDDDHCVEKIEMALKYFEKLVRGRPDDLGMVSIRLVRYLLYLNDPYSIQGFNMHQHKGLVALAVCSTRKVVRFMIDEFYLPRRAISKRSLVLTVLRESSMEMSNRKISMEEMSSVLPNGPTQERREAIRRKYDQGRGKKTRVWGRFDQHEKKNVGVGGKKNTYLKFAECYFYPLLSNYDSGEGIVFRMLSGESFLFSEFVTTLSTFVHCCGNHYVGFKLASSLLEFLWYVKYHFRVITSPSNYSGHGSSSLLSSSSGIIGRLKLKKEENVKKPRIMQDDFQRHMGAKEAVSVRRSVLHGLLVVVSTLPEHLLLEHETRISEFVEWLIEVEKNEADEKSREFAILVLANLKEKMKFL